MRPVAMRGLTCAFIAALSAFALSACSKQTGSAPTTPTSAATSTEAFSGTVPQLGSDPHPFTVTNAGTVTATLTSIAPLATMSIGVGIGNWDGTTCTTITQNDNARAGTAALNGTMNPGNYCVRVYDSGNIPDGGSVTYSVQVVHP